MRRRPLADWLVDELTERYYVPRKLAQAWTDAEQVLPLLDGLDEVAPEHRAACVEAINKFRGQHALVPLAVCSRAADYQALPVHVELSGAIVIKPLSRTQVSSYLKQAGKALAGVRTVLRDDETLWELVETPLMLSIVALAYRGLSAAEVRAAGSLEQRRAHLVENYTRRMFERRSKVTAYTPEQTLRWLTWLARSLMHNNLSVFYVEWMQPDWLPSRAHRWIVVMVPIMVVGLVVGLVGGLGGGLAYGLGGGLDRITPAEALRWSWRKARSSCCRGLGGGLVVGLASGLGGGLAYGLGGGLVVGLFFGLLGGLTTDQIVTRACPNEGIRRSLPNALISFLTGGLGGGLFFGLLGGLGGGGPDSGLGVGLFFGLLGGLLGGLGVGLVLGLRNGGFAYVKHHVLRILLWRNNYAPWSYIRFLDYAADRVFLRKVGGGYIFTHRLLMEYFATLPPTDQTGQTKLA